MRIDGLTVCVQYADLLRNSIGVWKRTLDSLLVITTPADDDTIRLCNAWDLPTYQTDAFTADGAVFNKGRAIADAYDAMDPSDWVLLFDADIIPPANWRTIAEQTITPGNLYGARRRDEFGKWIPDGELAGYFHLFHAGDVNAQQRPIVDATFIHAGNYDSDFSHRWQPQNRIWLPIEVVHQGESGRNWFGRGNDDAMKRMFAERRRRGGWQHERVVP